MHARENFKRVTRCSDLHVLLTKVLENPAPAFPVTHQSLTSVAPPPKLAHHPTAKRGPHHLHQPRGPHQPPSHPPRRHVRGRSALYNRHVAGFPTALPSSSERLNPSRRRDPMASPSHQPTASNPNNPYYPVPSAPPLYPTLSMADLEP